MGLLYLYLYSLFSWLDGPSGSWSTLRSSSFTLRRTTLGRTPLNEGSARRKDFYLTTHTTIIIIIFLRRLGRLTCSSIDALPSFPRASTISSSSRFVVEGVFRNSGVVHCFKMVDPVLFVFGSHVLYSRDLQFFSYNFASYFV